MFQIVAIALAVSGFCLESSARADDAEDKAVAFVEKLGGYVVRDEKVPGKPVVVVNMARARMTDAALKELASLKNLTTLYLHGTKVTDAGLKELVPLKNLTALYLDDTKVTDKGLKELMPLKNLTTLHLQDTKVTDAGLKELTPLKNLTALYLDNTKVTDAGVKELQKALPKCKIEK